jgi:NAD(P)-dependent dehydrogenase (short-subunit alcohol dehydrogenase family)
MEMVAMRSAAKVALVTGASSGFGRLIFIALARQGYRVFGAFRGSRSGFATESEMLMARIVGTSAGAGTVRMDVSNDGSVTAAVNEVVSQARRIDVLINCAAYGVLGPLECTTVEQVQRVYDTNVFGTMRVSKAVIPIMRKKHSGTIVNFSSDVGVRANFFQAAYASSKFAVEGLTQVMRLELRQFGIRVALMNPGWYETGFFESVVSTFGNGAAASSYEPLVSAWKDGMNQVEGPNHNPDEVAEAVLRILRPARRCRGVSKPLVRVLQARSVRWPPGQGYRR